MPNIGPAEILVILVVALLVFGPNKLPEIGRQVGQAARELRRMQTALRDEVRDVLEPTSERAAPPKLSPATRDGSGDEPALDEGGDEDLSPVDGEAADWPEDGPAGGRREASADTAARAAAPGEDADVRDEGDDGRGRRDTAPDDETR